MFAVSIFLGILQKRYSDRVLPLNHNHSAVRGTVSVMATFYRYQTLRCLIFTMSNEFCDIFFCQHYYIIYLFV